LIELQVSVVNSSDSFKFIGNSNLKNELAS